MAIKSVLFDLGNVLIFFSNPRMYQQIADVTGIDAATVERLLVTERRQWRWEAGQLSSEDVVQELRRWAKKPFATTDLLTAASDIFSPNLDMLPVLAGLKQKGIRLVVVSNTNSAHMDFATQRFECFAFFDALIFSFAVQAMKPDPAFYRAALSAAGCDVQECLFTDDLPENVEGARLFGFQTELFTSAKAFTSALAARDIHLEARGILPSLGIGAPKM